MKICAVIPAFNNESTIAKVVEATRRHIDHVVVIDDGSTDKTARLAGDAGAHVIGVSKNRGKGNALYFSNRQQRSYYRPIKDTFRISIIFLRNLFWKNR